jgi:hypothetical protein
MFAGHKRVTFLSTQFWKLKMQTLIINQYFPTFIHYPNDKLIRMCSYLCLSILLSIKPLYLINTTKVWEGSSM